MSLTISNNSATSICDLLITKNIINQETFEQAKKSSANSGKNIMNILFDNNSVNEEQIAQVIADNYGLPLVNLTEDTIDQEQIKLLPENFIKTNRVLPYAVNKGFASIAIIDPAAISLAANLKLLTKLQVDFTVTTFSNLSQAFAWSGFAAKQPATSQIDKEAKKKKKTRKWDSEKTSTTQYKRDQNEGFALEEDEEISSDVEDFVDDIIIKSFHSGTSDIHLEKFRDLAQVRFREDGVLTVQKEFTEFLESNYPAVITRLKIMSELNIAEHRLPQDGAISFINEGENIDVDIRLSILPNVRGERCVMRLLRKDSINIDMKKLGFPPRELKLLMDGVSSPQGLILVTGPTGSGKTTTLYSALSEINEPDINILTAEDPVEYELQGIGQTQMKDSIGLDFAAALRSFLRQDPDVVLVGEIRDKETSEIAIKAALTGHLVLSTLHTNSAIDTISRLVNMGVPNYLIAAALSLIIAQRLARKICDDCKEEDPKVNADLLTTIGFSAEQATRTKIYRGKGCAKCKKTGYKGRQGIYEVLEITDSIENAILQNKTTTDIRVLAAKENFITMQEMGRNFLVEGIISYEEFERVLSV
ncbi:MAG: putative type II secretion system protein HxcR [Alphaproteobacteria bacterium MarineAlpha5_Bin5]|nr:MAG: putative type II secretion system protein HxcR [Alphaproteobacteria bacterium MarineAlpha5_Bin5]